MHVVACGWIYVGEKEGWGTWLDNDTFTVSTKRDEPSFVYITSLYWVVTTLTTVGYGDIYGKTETEYIYTMIVEFIGILVFSIIMSTVNSFLQATGDYDIVEAKSDQVDVWLVKLDNSRMSKSLPKILYDKIKVYIQESLTHDHKKLIDGYEFLMQLKPRLRYQLIKSLFEPMINDFQHMFIYEDERGEEIQTGTEFLTFFVSKLYCRVFIANQTIIKRLEHFSELYLIFDGKVTLSLSHKDRNEYFTLYPTCYFGDYQILMGLRASETYKSSVEQSTYCHCLSKKDLDDLMITFPDAKTTFTKRAQARRTEFRRIKKQYERFANVDKQAELEGKEELDSGRFVVQHYSENSAERPPFLQDSDYYFDKTDLAPIEEKELEAISDSEMQTRTTQEDLEKKQKETLNKSLEFLVKQLDATNGALVKVKESLKKNSKLTIDFISEINKNVLEDEEIPQEMAKPRLDDLQSCLYELNHTSQTYGRH